MKHLLLIAALAGVMFMGCKTTGSGAGDDTSPITTQEEANNALKKVYDEYKDDIILEGAASYSVKSGDTLSAISRGQYNNGFYFPLIMLASSDVVLDPDKIEPGMKLTVPDLQRNLNNAGAKNSLKKFLVEIADVYDRRNRPQDASGLRDLSRSL
jgi:hypothetical protein